LLPPQRHGVDAVSVFSKYDLIPKLDVAGSSPVAPLYLCVIYGKAQNSAARFRGNEE
jgi:hypothetical protein